MDYMSTIGNIFGNTVKQVPSYVYFASHSDPYDDYCVLECGAM
jgi:hypothetical protein